MESWLSFLCLGEACQGGVVEKNKHHGVPPTKGRQGSLPEDRGSILGQGLRVTERQVALFSGVIITEDKPGPQLVPSGSRPSLPTSGLRGD